MECDKVRIENKDKTIESCCISCHEDEATGFAGDLWFPINGRYRNVCCAVARSFEDTKNETNLPNNNETKA